MNNTIELKDFIAKTLEDICRGISEAQEEMKKIGTNPIAPAYQNGFGQSLIRDVSFDIAITVSSSETQDKGVGLKISVIGGAINSEKIQLKGSVNRIQFSVPLFPQYLDKKK